MPKSFKILVLIAFIIILVAAAIYFFWNAEDIRFGPGMVSDSETRRLEETSNSDEVADIEADLSGTDLKNLVPELDSINSEINR